MVLTSFGENTTSRNVWLNQNISSGMWVIFLGNMMNSKKNVFLFLRANPKPGKVQVFKNQDVFIFEKSTMSNRFPK